MRKLYYTPNLKLLVSEINFLLSFLVANKKLPKRIAVIYKNLKYFYKGHNGGKEPQNPNNNNDQITKTHKKKDKKQIE